MQGAGRGVRRVPHVALQRRALSLLRPGQNQAAAGGGGGAAGGGDRCAPVSVFLIQAFWISVAFLHHSKRLRISFVNFGICSLGCVGVQSQEISVAAEEPRGVSAADHQNTAR